MKDRLALLVVGVGGAALALWAIRATGGWFDTVAIVIGFVGILLVFRSSVHKGLDRLRDKDGN